MARFQTTAESAVANTPEKSTSDHDRQLDVASCVETSSLDHAAFNTSMAAPATCIAQLIASGSSLPASRCTATPPEAKQTTLTSSNRSPKPPDASVAPGR